MPPVIGLLIEEAIYYRIYFSQRLKVLNINSLIYDL